MVVGLIFYLYIRGKKSSLRHWQEEEEKENDRIQNEKMLKHTQKRNVITQINKNDGTQKEEILKRTQKRK